MFLCDTQTSLCEEKAAVTSCCSTVSAALHALTGSLADVVPHCFSWHLANRWPWLSDTPRTCLADVSLHWWAHIWWRGGGRFHEWFRENVSKCWKTGSVEIYREISKRKTFFTAVAGWAKGILFCCLYLTSTKTTLMIWETSESKTFSLFYCALCVYLTADVEDLTQPVFCYWDTDVIGPNQYVTAENNEPKMILVPHEGLKNAWMKPGKAAWTERTHPSTTSAIRDAAEWLKKKNLYRWLSAGLTWLTGKGFYSEWTWKEQNDEGKRWAPVLVLPTYSVSLSSWYRRACFLLTKQCCVSVDKVIYKPRLLVAKTPPQVCL